MMMLRGFDGMPLQSAAIHDILSDLMITAGHWTISGQFSQTSGQHCACSDKMAGRKRSVNVDGATLAPDSKRRNVSVKTVIKWVAENEKTLSTATWLAFECIDGDRYHVARLKCSVCTKFKSQLHGGHEKLQSCFYRWLY